MSSFWQTKTLAEKFSVNVAIQCQETQLTYRQLHQAVVARQKVFSTLPLLQTNDSSSLGKPVKRLWLVVAKPSIEFIVSYLALLSLKQAVWLTSDHELNDRMAIWQESYDITYLIDKNDIVHPLDNINQQTVLNLPESLALLLSTSGTTGSSKLVMLSDNSLDANCRSICQFLPITSTDSTITTLPLHYSFGLSVLHTHLFRGSTVVLTENSVMSANFWQQFKQHKVSCFYGVPFHFQMLIKLGLARVPSTNIKFFAAAGGKLDKDIVTDVGHFCQQHNKQFFVMYGQTEATARMSYLAPQNVLNKPTSIGKAIAKGQLSLIDDEERAISTSFEQGQLVYHGENVMLGYANNMADLISNKPITKLKTGDLAYYDDDGDFYIVGRLKRIIKLSGYRINLDEVEQFILDQEYPLESVAAIDVNDKLYVLICSSMATKPDITEIKETLVHFLQIHGSKLEIQLTEQLPRLPSEKIDYAHLVACHSQGGDCD